MELNLKEEMRRVEVAALRLEIRMLFATRQRKAHKSEHN